MSGPHVVNQVVHAATKFGHVARCGCGWRAVLDTKIGAVASGQRHVHHAHSGDRVDPPTDRNAA